MKKLPPKKCRTNSKEHKIRTCLLAGQTLTPKEAWHFFGHMRLADVVLDLRKEGVNILNIGMPGKHAVYYRKK